MPNPRRTKEVRDTIISLAKRGILSAAMLAEMEEFTYLSAQRWLYRFRDEGIIEKSGQLDGRRALWRLVHYWQKG